MESIEDPQRLEAIKRSIPLFISSIETINVNGRNYSDVNLSMVEEDFSYLVRVIESLLTKAGKYCVQKT